MTFRKNRVSKHYWRRSLALELLEPRELMATDVTVELVDSALSVVGTDGPDQIMIHQTVTSRNDALGQWRLEDFVDNRDTQLATFDTSAIDAIMAQLGVDDEIDLNGVSIVTIILEGNGGDRLTSGDGDDARLGVAGRGRVFCRTREQRDQ